MSKPGFDPDSVAGKFMDAFCGPDPVADGESVDGIGNLGKALGKSPPPNGIAWRSRSGELARFTLDRLVNRDDGYGVYYPDGKGSAKGSTKKARLTLEVLGAHYQGKRAGYAVGLHTTRIDGSNGSRVFESRWCLVDIDHHEEGQGPPENEQAVVTWWKRLQARGHESVLEASNGRGGFHLWMIFSGPIPTADAKAFGDDLVADWQALGLKSKPEIFPSRRRRRRSGIGSGCLEDTETSRLLVTRLRW